MMIQQPADLIKTTEAQLILGVSSAKMSRLLKEGVLKHWANPLDNRVKLVSKSEVLGLKPRRVEAT